MSRFIQLHSVAAAVIGTTILLVGAALGLGVASCAGHPVVGGLNRVPVYITQARGAVGAVSVEFFEAMNASSFAAASFLKSSSTLAYA